MRCCTERALLTLLAALTLGLSSARALTQGEAAPVTLAEIESFRAGGIPPDKWPVLLEVLGREEQGPAVRALILSLSPFPGALLVERLADPKLAVRLGALDLLEDAAGDTFGFDPWRAEPAEGSNAAALERWHGWAGNEAAWRPAFPSILSDDSFRTLAMEIVSGGRERSERATQRLEAFGTAVIGRIEALLAAQTTLEPGARAALKGAEYRVLLRQALPRQAVALARQLALGSADTQATALPTLAEGGPAMLPIVADFLGSPDALVRETAVDAAFKAGAEQAVDLTFPMLRTEKAESVLHALLRNLGEKATGPKQVEAIATFLAHPSENVAITAAEALHRPHGGDLAKALTARLADSRWRVRAAVAEAIGKRGETDFAPQIEKMLDDRDQYVRVTAVEALHNLQKEQSHAVLIARFARQDELKPAILQALLSENKPPPDEVWDVLAKARPEVILECLETLEDRFDHEGKRVANASRFAANPNTDVAASALRLLATYGQQLGVLLQALKSSNPVLQDAVLDQLHLPVGYLGATASAEPAAASPRPHGALDRLYDMLSPSTGGPGAPAAAAYPAQFRAVLEGFFHTGSPRRQFRAAVILAGQGDSPAAEYLLAHLETLSGLDRRLIAAAIGGVPEWAPPLKLLMVRLLADPADDVRESTIQAWLEKANAARILGLLTELRRPGTLLKADDLSGWEFDRAAEQAGAKAPILQWAQAVLDDAGAADPHKVMAMILLTRSHQQGAVPLERFLTAPNPWLRRAAWRAIGPSALDSRVDALLHDEAAMVRAALPFLASPHTEGWLHWFDDAHSVADSESFGKESSSSRRPFGSWAQKSANGAATANPAVLAGLEKLTKDPSDQVRFEALFALLRLDRPLDPAALAALVPSQPAETNAGRRLGEFLNEHYTKLGPAYAVLVPQAHDVQGSLKPKLEAHFGLDKARPPATFAALARQSPAPPPTAADRADRPVAPLAHATSASHPFRVIFFHKAGCRDCDNVRRMLAEQAKQLSGVTIEELDIALASSALLSETLSARFHIKDSLHQVAPAVFTQAGALLREEITFPRLGELLHESAALEPDPQWARVAAAEAQVAQTTIVQRYNALSASVVTMSGLLDGINPCAIATIVFLLSYLQVARRAPGEILRVGAAFVSAVFLTYFAIGLGLAEVLARLSAVRLAGTLLNYGLAAFALFLAMLSFRDAQLAAQGQAGEMALQLPDALKGHIRAVIRSGARTPRFVAAAFAAGVIISLLELACTAQVYLPTIQYMLRSGRSSAVWQLALYNVAFVLPLAVVFLLAWAGFRSDALLRLQQRHTTLVKVLTGLLFLALTLLLLFGYQPLAALKS